MSLPRREPNTGPTAAPPPDAVDRRPTGNDGSLDGHARRPRARSAI